MDNSVDNSILEYVTTRIRKSSIERFGILFEKRISFLSA